MPFPLALIPIITALIGGGAAIAGQRSSNRQNQSLAEDQQQWNLEQWFREVEQKKDWWNMQNQYNQGLWNQQNTYNEAQRDNERAYNLEMWNMQNKYNSPQEQMARFTEAGLNPHLIYGQGSTGNAGSLSSPTMRASQVESNALQSPDVKGYSRANVESVTRGLDVFGDYQRFNNLQAQTNNIEAQTDLAKQDALLKAQQGALNAIGIKSQGLKYRVDKQLADTTVQAAQENLRITQAQVKKSAADAAVSVNTKDSRIKEAEQRVRNMVKQYQGQELENKLKAESLKLRKLGVTESDNIIARILAKIFSNSGVTQPPKF